MASPFNRPRLRSPVLAAHRDWTDAATPRILRRRRAAMALVVASAGALALLVRLRLIPLPAAFTLYWLHDAVALPLWGYTWSRFAPFSVTWWSLLVLLASVWLATFLTRRSVVRGAHVWLSRWLIRRFVAGSSRSDRYTGWLTSGVDWLAVRTFGAELLREVARLEHAEALAACINGPAGGGAGWRLVRLTDLMTRLMSGARSSAGERWSALAIWHRSLRWIDRSTADDPRRDALLGALAATGTHLLARLDTDDASDALPVDRSRAAEREANHAAPAEGAFAAGLRRDLAEAVGYARAAGASGATDIVAGAAARLDEIWTIATRPGDSADGQKGRTNAVGSGVVEAWGELSLDIGLHAAWLDRDAHAAMDYLQAFEALTFVQHLGAGGRDEARALTARAPQPDHYRFARDLLAERTSRLQRIAGPSRAALDELEALERITLEGLSDAAGPDFDAIRPSPAERPRPSRWQAAGRDIAGRLRHALQYRPMPLRRRIDPILIGGAAAAMLFYGLSTGAIVLLFGSSETGSWSARSLADRRILENVRRELAARPFLDAVFHGPDRQLVIAQAGGTIHSFDPATALWNTTRPFASRDLVNADIRLLSSSDDGANGPVLWGITADGGLVRRQDGRWDVAIADTRFVGGRGAAVQHADLTAIAVSADGRWLVAGAGASGVGIQDLARRRWLGAEEVAAGDKPANVTHAAWWWDRFYVGGPEGLWELAVNRTPAGFQRVKTLPGSVVALEPVAGQGLFVLQSATCDNGPKDCVRLSMLAQPFAKPSRLIDERNRYPELTLDRTLFAEQWNDHLVLAGGSGIFDYDTRLRSWKRSTLEPVTTVAACRSAGDAKPDAPCFYYGFGGRSGGVGLFTPKTLAGEAAARWSLPGEQPAQVAAGASGAVAVLAASGRAYALANGKPPLAIHPATSSTIAPDRFRDAVAFGDKILFFGPGGALVHDVVRRDYRTLTAVPDWLRSPDAIVRASGSFLFGLERRGTTYAARVVPQQQVELGTLVLNTAAPLTFEGPIRALDATSRDTLRVIDGRGRVLSLGPGGIAPLTGGAASDIAGLRPLDVAASADGLAVSTSKGVRLYSSRSRSWSDALATPPGEAAVEIAERRGAWLARSAAGHLVSLGAGAATLVGGGSPMPRGRPTDALASGHDVYLAWPGTVARYDAAARAVTNLWDIEPNQALRIRGIVGSQPLTLAGGVARLADSELARNVHSVFAAAGRVWFTREDRGERYLEIRPSPDAAADGNAPAGSSCLFRNSSTGPDVTEIRDARRVANGLVAATTNAGARLYSSDRRSWYALGNNLLTGTGRGAVRLLGAALLFTDATDAGATLQIVRSNAHLPDSCSIGPANFERSPDVMQVRSVAVDERARRAFALRADGGIDEISETTTTPWLAPPNEGPAAADIVRSWHFPDLASTRLFVATARELWHYDLARHVWSRIDLDIDRVGPMPAGTTLDLRPENGEIFAVADRSGSAYGAPLTLGEKLLTSIVLKRLDGDAQTAGQPARPPVFHVGAVTFFREVRHGLLAVIETEDGRSRTAYRNGRFIWDSGRRAVAVTPAGVLLESDAGLHEATSLASFDPGPREPGSPPDRLETGPDLVPRIYRNGRGYRRAFPGVWEPLKGDDPDAVAAEDGETQWIRRRGTIVVETTSNRRRIAILSRRTGLGLATDRLIDAAPYGGGFFLLTDGFVDLAELRPQASVPSTTIRLPAPAGDALEMLSLGSDESLWLSAGASVSLWNAERQAFEPVPAQANPYRRRRLAESGPLRFELADGGVSAELRVADSAGNSTWVPVPLDGGRFPFDVVRAATVVNGTLYLGTDSGLQVYDRPELGLDAARHVALAGGASAASPIDRIGEPCDRPGVLVACGAAGCFERSSETFVPTAATDALACRVRVRTPLWSWKSDATGVSGEYALTAVPAAPGASGPGANPAAPATPLADGRFPHDDIDQLAAFDGKLFTVWHGRHVGVHLAASLRLTADVKNHQFAEPVRLVALPEHIPLLRSPDKEIGPALYALEGGRTWRFADASWTRIDDAVEAATIVDYAANPPVLQRRRLRLVRRDGAGRLAFEMHMPGTEWTAVPWDAASNRLAIDVWQNIAVDRGTLWIATPAGMVGRDGNWTFDPNAFRFVDAPAAGAGQTITDLRAGDGSAELRFDGDSARVFRVALDDRVHPARYTAAARDPFVDQPFAVDSRYWSWGLAGRTGTSAGRLAATWRGEPIAVSNGRFDFDAVNSLAVVQGQLHVATVARGWFVSPAGSAALAGMTRPDVPAISAADITLVYDNHDPSQRELCLKEPTGQFVRLSTSGATRRTQGCPVLAAETDYWRYLHDAAAFRVVPSRGGGRLGERRLVDGRFTDEIVVGAPVAGSKNGRPFTLVPTAAGVMWWDAGERTVDMHAPPFQGKADVPRLLDWPSGGSPAYVADGSLYPLELDDKPRAAWTAKLPPGATFERFASGPGQLLSLDWTNNGRRHHTVIDPRNNSVSHDEIPIDARSLPAYFRRAMTDQSHDGLIRLRLRDKVLRAYAGPDGWPLAELDDSFQLLAGVAYGTRAMLVGPRHLIELNMDTIAHVVYSGEKPPPESPPSKK